MMYGESSMELKLKRVGCDKNNSFEIFLESGGDNKVFDGCFHV